MLPFVHSAFLTGSLQLEIQLQTKLPLKKMSNEPRRGDDRYSNEYRGFLLVWKRIPTNREKEGAVRRMKNCVEDRIMAVGKMGRDWTLTDEEVRNISAAFVEKTNKMKHAYDDFVILCAKKDLGGIPLFPTLT